MGGMKLNSAGHNNIPLSLLGRNIELLGIVILNICNRSLAEEVFPKSLKVAKVIPIFKIGERESLSDYRPISGVPSFRMSLKKKTVCIHLPNTSIFIIYLLMHNLASELVFPQTMHFISSSTTFTMQWIILNSRYAYYLT